MKFLVTWRLHEDKRHEIFEAFSQMTPDDDEAQLDGMNLIGRWHDVPNGNGVIIIETDNQENLTSWMMSWSSMCTFPIVKPVVDDQTGRKLVKELIASQS